MGKYKALEKAAKEGARKTMSIVSYKIPITGTTVIKKPPMKTPIPEQTTACGMVATSACNIPPAKHNKKSKL